jgi:hypothetical protein
MKLPRKQLKIQNLKFKIGIFFFCFFTFNFSLLTFNLSSASAQTQRTMTIVPPSVAANLDPGAKTEGKLKVINDSDTPLTFNAVMRDFIVQDSSGTPSVLPPDITTDRRFSASKWIAIYPSSFTVNPGEKQELSYYIQVPADARPGGHYAAVMYTPEGSGGPQGSGANVSTQIGTLFYVAINGPITEKADVTKFFANPFQEYGPVKILTQIRNLGDLHVKPTGNITVSNAFGGKVAEIKFDEKNIFPGGITRDYESTFGKGFLIGPYTAKFSGIYGKDNSLPLVASVTFWVFPWKITLVIILMIVAVILGRKYMNKKKSKKSSESEQNKHEEPKVESPSTT